MVELTIDYPARLLPDDISIIDAPGVMSDDAAEQSRTWSLIRQRADGCILLSEIERGVSAPAKRFLQQAREVVPHVLLVLTKVDLAFELAVQRGGGDPWEQVEQARRIGTRRFAREIGRDADAVLSIAVAAEAALEHGGLGTSLARRFEMEVDKLFQLLRHERALILGARSASALRGCIAGIAEAEAAVEHAYQARIAKLEADRIPEPDAFKQQQLDAVAPSVRDAAERAVGDASRGVDDGFKLIQAAIVERMSHVRTPREVLEEAGAIETDVNAGVAGVRLEANLGLESAIDVAVRDIEGGLFARLRTRYDLIHEVRREVVSSPRLDGLSESQTAIVPSSDRVTRAVVSFKRQRVGFGLGGAATGALIGSAVLPGLGTLAGALVGALLVFTRTTSALRKRVIANLFDSLTGERQAIVDELVARTDGVAEAIRAALDRSLDRVIRRFERFISEPIEAERRAIENERAKLRDIEALAGELERHDRRLAELMKAAADESLGLCR